MLIVQAPLCTSKKYFKKKENSKHQSKSCTTKKHFFYFLSLIIFRTYPHCIPLKNCTFYQRPWSCSWLCQSLCWVFHRHSSGLEASTGGKTEWRHHLLQNLLRAKLSSQYTWGGRSHFSADWRLWCGRMGHWWAEKMDRIPSLDAGRDHCGGWTPFLPCFGPDWRRW